MPKAKFEEPCRWKEAIRSLAAKVPESSERRVSQRYAITALDLMVTITVEELPGTPPEPR